MSYRVALLIAAASMLGFAGAAYAESVTVTKAVQDACDWEYGKFCNQYGSELLDMTKAASTRSSRPATFRRNMSISRRSCSAASRRVTPAKAGSSLSLSHWIPACTGMTVTHSHSQTSLPPPSRRSREGRE